MTPFQTGLVALVSLLTACQTAPADHPGKAFFDARCAGCHGEAATGDGPMASELPVAPPDLTTLQRRAGGPFPHEAVMAQIYGYPGRYHLGLMPEFSPDLGNEMVDWTAPDGSVTPTPRALLALVDYLVSLQQ